MRVRQRYPEIAVDGDDEMTISNNNPHPDAIVMTNVFLGADRMVVVHRDATGEPYCFHSPLETGPVHCTLCETPGARVALMIDDGEE